MLCHIGIPGSSVSRSGSRWFSLVSVKSYVNYGTGVKSNESLYSWINTPHNRWRSVQPMSGVQNT